MIEPRHKISEKNRTPREMRRNCWKNRTPFSLFDFQIWKEYNPVFPVFLTGGYSQEGGNVNGKKVATSPFHSKNIIPGAAGRQPMPFVRP